MGNAPVGFHSTEKERKKIYFFKAQVAKCLNEEEFLKKNDYIWVHKNELKNFIKSDKYLKEINKFILDF
jgi:hypothetical protein